MNRRIKMAVLAYTMCQALLVADIIYLALGVDRVLTHVANNEPGESPGAPLHWPSTIALYGGVVLYLAGRILFVRLTVGSTPRAEIIATVSAVALLPAAHQLHALAAFALLTAILVALVGYERLTWKPAAAAR